MRIHGWLLLMAAVLPLGPVASAESTANCDEVAKVGLAHLNARRFFGSLKVLPAGLAGVYVFPQDDALIVRGSPSAITEMRSAVAVADAPLKKGRLVFTLRRAAAASVVAAALALPHSGTIQARGMTLQFEGSADWLEKLPALVFGAELIHPEPMTQHRGEGGNQKIP